jgi:hypothetical protein
MQHVFVDLFIASDLYYVSSGIFVSIIKITAAMSVGGVFSYTESTKF